MDTSTTPVAPPYNEKCKTQLMKYTKNPALYYCLAEKPMPYNCSYSFTFGTACFCKHQNNSDFAE